MYNVYRPASTLITCHSKKKMVRKQYNVHVHVSIYTNVNSIVITDFSNMLFVTNWSTCT